MPQGAADPIDGRLQPIWLRIEGADGGFGKLAADGESARFPS